MDFENTKKHQGLMSAVRDIMMKNQDLRAQDLEKQYGHYGKESEVEQQAAPEVEVPTEPVVDAERDTGAEMVDPDTVTGAESESGEGSEPEQPTG